VKTEAQRTNLDARHRQCELLLRGRRRRELLRPRRRFEHMWAPPWVMRRSPVFLGSSVLFSKATQPRTSDRSKAKKRLSGRRRAGKTARNKGGAKGKKMKNGKDDDKRRTACTSVRHTSFNQLSASQWLCCFVGQRKRPTENESSAPPGTRANRYLKRF
jgi:hypothetical protein